MPTSFLRRTICSMAALALLFSPSAAGFARPASAAIPPGEPVAGSSEALAPIEEAFERLRGEAARWLSGLRSESTEAGDTNETKYLIPGGQNIGVALMCEGVLVVGTSDPGAAQSPARLAGIRSGDRITHVNGQPVVGSDQFSEMIAGGCEVSLTVCRDDDSRTVALQPVLDKSDDAWRIGAWVRDSTAGIGTMTFIDPETDTFGALGHAIQDADTYAMLPVAEGALYESRVVDVRRGETGVPGEIIGSFMENASEIGEIERNTSCGIFGRYAADYDEDTALPIADSHEVLAGEAQILTTLSDGEPQAYDIEILRLYADGDASSRSMMIQVTDPELIARTGGIVQGMSGSPILQDGRIVGAVTHVLVNDPTRGYGIFIENMLEAAA